MNPLWPSMLMSSTLVRDSSSVLRSRPMGLPRYQVKEKCGPRMPPPASHWHPTELPAVFTRPVTRVCSAMVWSLTPPHSGNIGPCLALAVCGADGCEDCDAGPLESDEHPLTAATAASATTASLPARLRALLRITACTVAASAGANHRQAA